MLFALRTRWFKVYLNNRAMPVELSVWFSPN